MLFISKTSPYSFCACVRNTSNIYSEVDNETGKWLSHIFGLAHLDQQEIEDCFVFEIMPDTPSEIAACERCEDYLDDRYSNLFLNAYINRHAHTEYLKMI